MVKIGKKIVDISEYGYNDPVVFKELTLGDAAKISARINAANKEFDNNVPEALVNMIILEHLIESAPFPHDKDGLEDVPLSLGVFLIEEAQAVLDPLANRTRPSSKATTAEVASSERTSKS
jgi:hypothetical protein